MNDPWAFGWTQLLTIVGFLITLCIAFGSFRTFGRWKREQIEERKLDGALEALSIAYEAQMVFEDIQRPFIGQHEWQNMPNGCELVGVVDASGLGTRPPLTIPQEPTGVCASIPSTAGVPHSGRARPLHARVLGARRRAWGSCASSVSSLPGAVGQRCACPRT